MPGKRKQRQKDRASHATHAAEALVAGGLLSTKKADELRYQLKELLEIFEYFSFLLKAYTKGAEKIGEDPVPFLAAARCLVGEFYHLRRHITQAKGIVEHTRRKTRNLLHNRLDEDVWLPSEIEKRVHQEVKKLIDQGVRQSTRRSAGRRIVRDAPKRDSVSGRRVKQLKTQRSRRKTSG
jgi:hypothetical protein